MTDPTPAGESPPSTHPDTSTDADVDETDVADLLDDYRHDLGAAQAEAMEWLDRREDIKDQRQLYQRAGFSGDVVTVQFDVYDAELYALLDLLDRLTDSPQSAPVYVALARLLDALLDDLDPALVTTWLKSELEGDATDDLADVATEENDE